MNPVTEQDRNSFCEEVAYIIDSKEATARRVIKAIVMPKKRIAHAKLASKIDDIAIMRRKEPEYYSKRFMCTWIGCEYACSRLGHLNAHMCTHTGVRPFRCSWAGCVFSCSTKSKLVVHSYNHTGIRPFKCSYFGCTYHSSTSSNIKKHLLTHSGEKTFKCTWDGCPYICNRNENLKIHKRGHMGAKPYKCMHVGCIFECNQKSSMNRHLKSHSDSFRFSHFSAKYYGNHLYSYSGAVHETKDDSLESCLLMGYELPLVSADTLDTLLSNTYKNTCEISQKFHEDDATSVGLSSDCTDDCDSDTQLLEPIIDNQEPVIVHSITTSIDPFTVSKLSEELVGIKESNASFMFTVMPVIPPENETLVI